MTKPQEIPAVSTGVPELDEALGIGGLPEGRVIDITGPADWAIYQLMIQLAKQVQSNGGLVAFVDCQHDFDLDVWSQRGVNPAQLLISQPDDPRLALQIIHTLAKSRVVDLVLVNGAEFLPKMVNKEDYPCSSGDFSRAMREITSSNARSGSITAFFDRGARGRPPGRWADNALKFYASVRMLVSDDGGGVSVKVVKNKLAPPFRTAEFRFAPVAQVDRAQVS